MLLDPAGIKRADHNWVPGVRLEKTEAVRLMVRHGLDRHHGAPMLGAPVNWLLRSATGLAMSPLGNRLKSSIVRGISAASTSNSDSLTCTGWDSTGIATTSSSQENTRRIFIEISKG